MSLRSRLGWYAARASAMSGREILHRAATAATVARDRVAPPDAPPCEAGRAGARRHADAPRLIDDARVRAVRELPGAVERARAAALPAAAGRVTFFGLPEADVGTRPNWHRDPSTGHLWPLEHWSRIDHREADADPKWIWELGRHQHLVHLARAWRLTGDDRFAAAACDGLDSFLDQNPSGRGIHWRVGLELGLRLASWAWTLAFLEGYSGLSATLHTRLLSSAAAHLAQLERYPSLYSSANNHRIGELMGLAVGGLCFPEVAGAERFARSGLDGLERELDRQTHSDGVNAEQAIGYQCFVLDMVLAVVATLRAADREVPTGIARPLAAMAELLASVASDAGSLPAIGDQDDALGIDLAAGLEPAERLWSRLRSVERLLEVDLARHEPGSDEQTLWFAGTSSRERPRRLPGDALFADGGYAILRDRSAGELRLVLKAGPFGLGPLYAHAHADQLSLTVALDGEEVIVDGGTFTYYGDESWRDYGRSTAAHSTLRVDGREQAEPAGRFMWSTTARGHMGALEHDDTGSLVTAWHDAYLPIRHVRRVHLAGRAIEVDDRLVGGGDPHRAELRWHFAPGRIDPRGDGWTWSNERVSLRITIDGLDTCRVAVGETDPPAGVISTGLERRRSAPALIGQIEEALPIRIRTTIAPG